MDALLATLGLKKALLFAGLAGGAISGWLSPGVLVALDAVWKRVVTGSACGALLAGFGAQPFAEAIGKPDYLQGIALGFGIFGLSAVFKVLKWWDGFDLGGVLNRIIDRKTGNGRDA